jgi:hypothetical protein
VEPASLGALNGESSFAIARITTDTFTMFNEFAESILSIHEAGTPLPVIVTGCQNVGQAVISDASDSDPLTYRVSFQQFRSSCRSEFPLTVFNKPQGGLWITLIETDPGLSYTVDLPFDWQGPEAEGITVQLPPEVGIELELTTPYGPLDCELDRDRDAGEGLVSQAGTLRWEDRAQPFVIVQELAVAYGYLQDRVDDVTGEPVLDFDLYPVGGYEIATWGGTFSFGSSGAGFPMDTGFNGAGGVTFTSQGFECSANLIIHTTEENPCAGIGNE